MGFKLGDIIVDRISMGVAENFNSELLYTLTQLADGTIDTSATSKDAVDKDGTLVKRFWTGKTGTFTANNAMINLNILGSVSGSTPEIATETKPIVMPRVMRVKATDQVTLTDYVDGTVHINALDVNGAMGRAYDKAAAASETEFAIATDGALTLPTDENEVMYIIKYSRTVKSGVAIKNKADKFPDTIRLTLKVLAVDPCHADTLRAAYIYMPSFQPSPETSLSLTTDAKLEYKGDLQIDYCAVDKTLYEFYWADEDEEDE